MARRRVQGVRARKSSPQFQRVRRLTLESLENRLVLSTAAGEALPGQWITKFDGLPGSVEEQRSVLTQRMAAAGVQGITVDQSLGLPGMFTLKTSQPLALDWMTSTLQGVDGFQFVEADRVVTSSAVPNDTSFGSLWGMHNTGQTIGGATGTADVDIDAPEAWDISTGSSNVIVGVIDTGIDFTHPDLNDNLFVNPGEIPSNGVDDDANGFVDDWRGWDFYSNDNNPTDDNGHGTHVSGTIGAEGNNGIGVAGVNWDVTILPLKFLGSSGTGPLSAAIAAVNYATMMRNRGFNIKVTNNSWGSGTFDAGLQTAIDAQRQAGILFVAAAGNGGSDNIGDNNDFWQNYPSNYALDNILAVAAITNQNQRASFSNYGATTVDLAAPGQAVYSTVPSFVSASRYAYFDGTSMATPHVAGAAALLWSVAPTATYTQVRDAILQTVDPVSSLSNITVSGGRLNVRRALEQFVTGPRVTASSTNIDANGAATGVTFTFNKPVDPLTFTTADITSFTGPGGVDLLASVTGVTSLSATSFRVDFAPRPLAGSYAITIGPGINDLDGNPMDQDSDLAGGEVPEDRYTGTFSIAAPRITSSTPTGSQDGPVSSTTLTFSKAIDAASFTLADIASFIGPGGADLSPALTAITQVSPTQYRIDFTSQTAVGGYTLVVGPDILDLGGNAMDQDSDGTLAEPIQDRFSTSFSITAPRVTSSNPYSSQRNPVSSMTFSFSKPIDAASFSMADIVSFTGPGSANLLSSVTGVSSINSTTFRVDFTAQKKAGDYSLVIGPGILDLVGNPLDQNFNSKPGEIPGDRYTGSFYIPAPRAVYASPSGTQTGPISSITYTFSETIDVNTFTTADIASFSGPGGVDLLPAVTGIVRLTDTTFRVNFAPQGTAGLYKIIIGPDIRDALGNQLDQDYDDITGEPTQDRFATSFAIEAPLITSTTPANSTSTDPKVLTGSLSNILITFSKPMDAASFTSADLVLTGPGGVDLTSTITSITAVSTTRFQINFAPISAQGDYRLLIGPNVLDVAGNPLDQDDDGTAGEPLQDRLTLDFRMNLYGPDGYGYTATATPFQNIDLELGQPGVFQILDNLDDASVAVDLGSNTFNFYGTTYTGNNHLFVSTNGLVTFDEAYASGSNGDLGFSPMPAAIAPFWDDLKTNVNTADQVLGRFEDLNGDSVPDRLIIEWSSMEDWAGSGSSAGTFQLILELNTGVRVSTFIFNYVDLDFGTTSTDNGASATTGIKDKGYQYSGPNVLSVNQNSRTNSFVSSGKAIRWAAGSTIQGQVWEDTGADGVRDDGEGGLSGRTVYLDLDSDQTLDLGEPSALTAADGSYAFTNLLPGSYLIRQLDHQDWMQSAPMEVFQSTLPNSGFESGAFGPQWATIGATAIVSTVDGVIAPEGGRQAAVSTRATSATPTALAAFIGRPETSLDTLIGSDVEEGSAIKRTIQATAGQVLSFQWNFFTNASVNSTWDNDFSFVSIVGPTGINQFRVLASTFDKFVSLPTSSSFYRMTGYRTFSYTIPTTGTYTLAIGACDVEYSGTDSQIVVDDLQLVGGTESFGRPLRVGLPNAKTTIAGKDFGSAPLNTPPTALALSANAIAENQPAGTAVGTFSTIDADTQDTFVYTLVSGAGSDDNGAFTISGNTLQTAASFNFEGKSSYSFRVRTTDAGGLWTEQTFAIQVVDANEAPVSLALGNDTLAENLASGATVGTLATGDPDVSDTFTYTLVSGVGSDDNGSFSISGDKLLAAASFNLEAKSTYTVRVRSTDAGGLWTERTFTIHISNVNEAPSALALSGNSLAENLPAGTLIGDFSATDADANESLTYTLVPGSGSNDNALFSIAGGQLKAAAMLDFETQSSFSIRVRATDAGSLWKEQVFTIQLVDINEPPITLELSNNTIPENASLGSLVGSFSSIDPDTGESFTYTLVSGDGDSDNSNFNIVGNQLVTATTVNFENQSSFSIRVRVTDTRGLWIESVFSLSVNDGNDTPTAIGLSNALVEENASAGSIVGTLITTDPDGNDTFTYSLAAGTNDQDNSQFIISGSQLVTAASFNFEGKSSYSIRVRSTDSGGLWTEQTFTISVADVNEAPVNLTLSNNTVLENLSAGATVGSVTSTDPDIGDTVSYALVPGEGSTDNNAFTLSGNTLVAASRFNFEAKSSYSIRVRATDIGSKYTEQVFVVAVVNTNDAPVLNSVLQSSLITINEDNRTSYGTPLGTLLYGIWDPDAAAKRGMAIIGASDTDNGTWQFTLDNGANWQPLGSVSPSAARLLAVDGNQVRIRFVPNLNFHGTVNISYVAWDLSQGVAGSVVDLSDPASRGGVTPFSDASRTGNLTITAVNDAPILNNTLSPTLLTINQGDGETAGTPVEMLLSGVSDVDAGAAKGLAITSASGAWSGAWQFTLDGGNSWQALGAVSLSSARLLPAKGDQIRVRFIPNANFHGTVQLGFFAWDQTQGTPGGTWDLSQVSNRGGTKAFSNAYETASLTINPGNSAPVVTLAGSVGYTLNFPAVLLASTAKVRDSDSTNFAGGWLKVEITNGADAGDRLSLGGAFKVIDGNVLWNNSVTIGTLQGGLGTTPLLINLNANATLYCVDQLVRAIKFNTLGGNQTGLRTMAFSLNDGAKTSNVATMEVQVSN